MLRGDIAMHDGCMRLVVLWGELRRADERHDFKEVNVRNNLSRVRFEQDPVDELDDEEEPR